MLLCKLPPSDSNRIITRTGKVCGSMMRFHTLVYGIDASLLFQGEEQSNKHIREYLCTPDLSREMTERMAKTIRMQQLRKKTQTTRKGKNHSGRILGRFFRRRKAEPGLLFCEATCPRACLLRARGHGERIAQLRPGSLHGTVRAQQFDDVRVPLLGSHAQRGEVVLSLRIGVRSRLQQQAHCVRVAKIGSPEQRNIAILPAAGGRRPYGHSRQPRAAGCSLPNPSR